MSRIQSHLESDRPMRVLNDDMSFRLRSAIVTIRALADLGYRVKRQELRQGEQRKPLLILRAGDNNLRNRCTSVTVDARGEATLITGRFKNCDVRWEEPRRSCELVPMRARAAS